MINIITPYAHAQSVLCLYTAIPQNRDLIYIAAMDNLSKINMAKLRKEKLQNKNYSESPKFLPSLDYRQALSGTLYQII